MKKLYIINEAKQVKQFVEKNKRLPKTCNINGEIYSIFSTSYLSALLIQSKFNKSEYKLVDVIRYNNSEPKDTINEKVLKEDYLKMIDNFIRFCKENRRVPAYITTQKTRTKVSYSLFVYCITKIIVFYHEKGHLPNYCHFLKSDVVANQTTNDSSNKSPAKPIASCQNKINSNKGCDAMGQNNSYFCGVCALQKCLYKFGINETQKALAKVCGTTTAGTSHNGLKTGIAWASKKHKVNLTVKEAYFSDYTLKQLKDIICNKNKAVICHDLYRQKYGHYEFIKSIDVDKKEFEIVNSLGSKCPLGCYCGYIEKRSYATQKQYCNGVSQKSLIIIEKR